MLYRAADAIDRSGNVREVADALYADLYGLEERDGTRRSLLTYFHGRSSLATWLRAVLAQRHVDRVRLARRMEPFDAEDQQDIAAVPAAVPDPGRDRLRASVRRALMAALTALDPRDRLRLACYYAQQLTLAEIGRLLHEHEATVSRRLSKVRRSIRRDVERRLRQEGLNDQEIDQAFEAIIEDAGSLDLAEMLRKKSRVNRSVTEEVP